MTMDYESKLLMKSSVSQAAQKDLRGEARENRRVKTYLTSTLERGDCAQRSI